ncbi:hypothetical protein SAMN04244572_04191 [Azotobacter beijerinckii]|uniref:Uncharacterized protein n=1 Tax=Azotobacter beijerinckii TaxID=170623 RepID=A0A1H6Z9J5_9GAMM|nr:hypothetical protein [Azotobacter beijerinckii]SEJ48674.1 hypothetical protein SAMN04244572_04191 [Azotobacter beijerinckii]
MKKAAPQYQQSSPSHGHSITSSASPDVLLKQAPTKIARVLAYFRHVGDLNRFEAARLVGDTCLNSTIPDLEDYGLVFEHLPERSPNHWGEPCAVTRLPASQYDRADKVLALMFSRSKGHKEAAA